VSSPVRSSVDDLPARVAADEYWLRHCEGFRVDGRAGRIGYVEEVRVGDEARDVVTLAIRAGRLGMRVLLFSGSDVSHVVPQAQRVWLRTSASLLGTERRA
jgi:hypothetical protein